VVSFEPSAEGLRAPHVAGTKSGPPAQQIAKEPGIVGLAVGERPPSSPAQVVREPHRNADDASVGEARQYAQVIERRAEAAA
jgi:hypothetical protein